MPFTFECGVCHSVYRLDEHQITGTGVKITCPKCLNYFFLKRGSTEGTEPPVVEYVVADGAYDVSQAVSPPSKEHKPPPAPTKPSAPAAAVRKPVLGDLDMSDPFYPPTLSTRLTEADLSDYPPDRPPKSPVDLYFWPLSSVLVAIAVLLFLNFQGYIHIPGLDGLRPRSSVAEEPAPAGAPDAKNQHKHGFPPVDAGYDPWKGATALPTPAPEVTKKP